MQIDLSSIDEKLLDAVRAIAKTVRSNGGRALMVGGAVRDLMRGEKVKDIDLEVFGIGPEALKDALSKNFEFDACGLSFGVLKIKHLDIDVALPRRESKRGIGHKGFMIDSDPSLSVAEAAMRRDFTINAMYYDPLDGVFEDPYCGRDDLENGILRHISSKFAEDPLRVLRGAQFIARFDLSPAEETIEICRAIGIEDLPCERLFEEWSKLLLKGVKISKGLEFLRKTGWIKYFPELKKLIGCEQAPEWHPEGDVWNHTLLTLDAYAARRTGDVGEDLIVGLAVLCHDLGKPETSRFDPRVNRIRSLGHDEAGVKPTLSFLRRLTNEERILRDVPPLVQCHMQPFSLWRNKSGDGAIRRLAARVGRIDRLVRVARADSEGCLLAEDKKAEGVAALEWLEEAAARLSVASSVPKPILMGRDLIKLGYKPSVQFGKYLSVCYEAQLDGKFSDLDGALKFIAKHFGGSIR